MSVADILLFTMALLQTPAGGPPRTVERGAQSFIESPQQIVVRTPKDWATFWRSHAGDRQPPAVDFSKEMVVGVFSGSRPTAGHSVEIVRAVERDGNLVVEYVEKSPDPRAMTAQVITIPYHLVAIPNRPGEVKFERVAK
jgi:hypothetical protein